MLGFLDSGFRRNDGGGAGALVPGEDVDSRFRGNDGGGREWLLRDAVLRLGLLDSGFRRYDGGGWWRWFRARMWIPAFAGMTVGDGNGY